MVDILLPATHRYKPRSIYKVMFSIFLQVRNSK